MANSRFISGTGHTPFVADTRRTLLSGTASDTPLTTIPLPADTDPELAAITKESLHPSALDTVASYNWVYGPGKRLKIIVPGYPSCWNPPQLPAKLPPDMGFRMIHQNEYFSPGTPLRPLLRAVFTNRPEYDIRGMDYVTDRNSLLKLFKFVRGGVRAEKEAGRGEGRGGYRGAAEGRGSGSGSGGGEGRGAYRGVAAEGRGGFVVSGGGRGGYRGSLEGRGGGVSGGGNIIDARGGYCSRGRGRGTGVGGPPHDPRAPPTPPASPGPTPMTPSWRDRHTSHGGGGLFNRGRGRGGGLGYCTLSNMDPPADARIDIDIVGGGGGPGGPRASMLLSRWETHSSEVLPEGKFMGWGYQFLNRFTRFGDAGEEAVMDEGELQSHHRVVEYEMGGCRFLVRFHGDAVTEGLAEFRLWAERERAERARRERRERREREKEQRERREREDEVRKVKKREGGGKGKGSPPAKKADDWLEKEFVEGVANLTLNRVKTTIAIEAHKSLAPLYPHSAMVGIKTCSNSSAPGMMLRAIPQVFFSQTPHLFVGYHRAGCFDRVEKIQTGPLLQQWEDENEVVLKRYLVLLARIRDVVEGMEGRRATLVLTSGKEEEGIKVYKRAEGEPGPVPSDLVAKWDV